MVWWKRGIFSLISLVVGFFSLDYLILAFRLLTDQEGRRGAEDISGLVWQILGAGMFLLYAAALAGYFYLVRKNASFLPTYRGEERKSRWKGPRLEISLQFCVLVTGLMLRFGYLLCIYLPGQMA